MIGATDEFSLTPLDLQTHTLLAPVTLEMNVCACVCG